MATPAIYQHHERTTTSALEADLQLRELGIDPQAKCLSAYSEVLSTVIHTIGPETVAPTLLALTVSGGLIAQTTLAVTGIATFTAAPVFSSGTASQTVELTAGKAVTTVAITGTGNYVKSASPTLTGTIAGASETLSGTLGVTGVATFTAQPVVNSLTASLPVFSDSLKGLVSNAMTGTGNVVMSASPTLTGTIGAQAGTFATTLGVTGVATFTAQPIFSSVTASTAAAFDSSKGIVSVTNTGTGNNVLSASPTLTGTIVAASANFSGRVNVNGATDTTFSALNVIDQTICVGKSASGGSVYVFGTGQASDVAAGNVEYIRITHDGSNATLQSGKSGAGATARNLLIKTGTGSVTAVTISATDQSFTFAAQPIFSTATASTAAAFDSSKGLVSVTNTGTGNNVLSASPTFTGTAVLAAATFSSTLTLSSDTFSNAIKTISAGTMCLGQTGTMSASRAVTLPAASGYPRGTLLIIADESGTTSATNTLVLTRAGSDTINGATTKTLGIVGGYDTCILVSDGTSKWTVVSSI